MEQLETVFLQGAGLELWQSLLFALGICVLLCEAATPGAGLLGVAGILCLLGCYLPGLAANLYPWYLYVLLVAGGVLCLLDSAMPGVGPLAWLGLCAFLGALVLSVSGAGQLLLTLLLVAAFSIPSVCIVVARIPKSKTMRQIRLDDTLEESAVAQPAATQEPFVGKKVLIVTDLRPLGVVMLGEKRLHAVAADGGFLPRGTVGVIRGFRNGNAEIAPRPTSCSQTVQANSSPCGENDKGIE